MEDGAVVGVKGKGVEVRVTGGADGMIESVEGTRPLAFRTCANRTRTETANKTPSTASAARQRM
ncbi:MAG: hypothetical protein U9Q78_07615 [Chloroflexota bacterium]|nr:hypothetical protein [Chloroflexota bacterium]